MKKKKKNSYIIDENWILNYFELVEKTTFRRIYKCLMCGERIEILNGKVKIPKKKIQKYKFITS